MNHESRRDFLKAAASVSLAGLPGYAAAPDVIRVGVIGSGGRGEAAAINAMNADKGVRIVAMADMRLDRMQESRAKLKLERPDQVDVKDDHLFTGFDAYRNVIGLSDVVIIANAAKFHPFHATAALDAGKHVFLEKPHAIDPAGVKMLRGAIDTARRKGLCLVSGLQSRYHPGYRETMQRVHDGAIGDIVTIQETWLRAPYVVRDRLPGQSEVEHQASNQYHFHWLCGDDVPQTLIHNLDRSRWALREAVPIRAYGMGGRSTLNAEKYGDVFDHDAVVYDFPGGIRVYAYCRTIDNCYDENSSLITGTKGRCDLLNLRISGETNWQNPGTKSKASAYDIEHVELFKAIRSGKPINNGDYMADSTLTGVMGQLCCYSGQELKWEQVKASEFYYAPRPQDCRAGMEPPVKPGPNGVYPVAFTPGVSKLL
jgi:myo-inositol 2-dehydrogenase / D-chiro-inositol 1-dehydrogenase